MSSTIGEAYLQIKPSMKGVKGELEQAMGEAGASASASFGSAFQSGLSAIAGIATAVVGAAVGGVAALTKEATSAYADYEQLAGGIETLFGTGGQTLDEFAAKASATATDIENSGVDWDKYADTAWMQNSGINGLLSEMKYNLDEAGTSAEELMDYLTSEYDLSIEDATAAVEAYNNAISEDSINSKFDSAMRAQELLMENASKAYETAGMSANDYMETAISSAASMISSVGGDQEKAAELVDMSIVDMSDNVNKMGTSMEAVQNAYKGFAKGNYTMLDNLALGFSGSKEGMEQLLAKAQELSGVEYNIDSYADIVQAIHVVQEEMGIAGTTSKEAAGTISGSVASMGAAWQNLVAGLANPDADIASLVDQFVQTALTALNNLMPTIVNALTGIAQALPQIVDAFVQLLPTVLPTIIPPLIEAAITLVQALVEALPTIMEALIAVLPSLIQTVVDTIITLLPMIIELGLELILALADGIIAALPDLIPAIVDVILTIIDKLTEPDTITQLIEATLMMIGAIAMGIIKAIPVIIAKVPEIIKNIITVLTGASPEMVQQGLDLLVAFVSGIIDNIKKAVEVGHEIFDNVKNAISEKIEGAKNWGKDLIDNFVQGIKDKIQSVKDTVGAVAQTVKDILGFSEPEEGPLSNFHTFAPDMMNLFATGIKQNLSLITDAMNDVTGTIASDFTNAEIAPSRYSSVADPNEALYGLMGSNLAAEGGNITIPVYIGQEKIDTIVINAQQRHALVSGGR